MKIAVLGAGRMGEALGRALVGAQFEVVIGHRDPAKAAALALKLGSMAEGGGMEAALKFAQVAFIALPYDCILQALKPLQNLENKILVDLSNPPDTRQTPVESWVERLQAALPRASVIKAFNTLSAQQLIAPSSRTRRPQTLIAGDDQVAKGKIAAIARTLRLDAIDAGPLNHGTWLEQLGLLNRYLNRNRHKAMPSSPTWLGL